MINNPVVAKLLNSRQIERYHREGCVFPVRVMSEEAAAECRRKLEDFERGTGAPLKGELRHKSHLLFTWIAELVRHERILDAVEDLYGPNLFCWTTNFFIKEAASPGFISWHQDSTYWGLEPHDVITAWVAFTKSDLVAGCMKVIPGTHLEDQLPHLDTFHKDNLLSRGQEIAVEVDQRRAMPCLLEPGEMSLHHIKLVHGSEPNRSHDRRIGFAIRYIPTYVRQTKVRDSAMLVRGVDRHRHFDHEPRPKGDLDKAALAAHADAVGRQVKALYSGTDKAEFRA